MANMSYCRFQNTVRDLRDCFDNMDDDVYPDEAEARLRIINLAVKIAESYGGEIGAKCDVEHDPAAFRAALKSVRERAGQ